MRKEQGGNKTQLRRARVSIDFCLDTDTCFIDEAKHLNIREKLSRAKGSHMPIQMLKLIEAERAARSLR